MGETVGGVRWTVNGDLAGLGRLTMSAISNRDYALVQGCLLSIGLTYVLVNFFTDVVYRWVNPRMRG
jgi:peptide/nickel transport system permease protein